jgi:UDP-N-acetylmuramoyl-L-alanyl-D-glutamate--2,6-diaminopimelate ligase
MRLDELSPNQSFAAKEAMASLEVRGLSADSRHVQPGYLFAALPGTQVDGQAFIGQAIENGATAILASEPLLAQPLRADVAFVSSDNPHRDLAHMAARFFEFQPAHIGCITGTNGKTSTASFLRQLLAAQGHKAAAMGTLGVEADGYFEPLHHTTPDPVRLHAALRDLSAHGVTHLAMEASSHGLAQHRMDGVQVEVAGFTNLSRDHLDYHDTPEAYEAAKQRLFTELLSETGTAVIVASHASGERLQQRCQAMGRTPVMVGRPEDRVFVRVAARTATGLQLDITLNAKSHSICVPLIGDFQTENLALALGMAQAFGVSDTDLFAACTHLQAPRGRMQFVGRSQKGASVYVDYAHTPDALDNALVALRAHLPTDGNLSVLFGCGGNRDAGKRPEMGKLAAAKADYVFVTDDNPRQEDAASIRAAILKACPDALEVGDRGEAIGAIIDAAQSDDIVLLAGKGHEGGQIIGDTILPFDDALVAQSHLSKKGGQHG